MEDTTENKNPNGLRVIKTARNEDSINDGADRGFRPLVRKIKPSKKIRSKYAVVQHKTSGHIFVHGDYRIGLLGGDYETVIDWSFYYPYNFESPFAAYLIPPDIGIGERVFVEDLIEDFVGSSWNQGDTYRLDSCEAIWNGSDLEFQYDRGRDTAVFIG